MCYDDHTRIIDLTVGELRQVLSELMADRREASLPRRRWINSRPEMASALGLSPRSFDDLKAKGVFDGVVIQGGKKMQAEEQALHEAYEGYLKSKKTKESPYDEKIEGIRRTRRVG